MIRGIIKMNVEVGGDDKFVRRGSSERKERIKFFEKNGEWFRWLMKEGGRC